MVAIPRLGGMSSAARYYSNPAISGFPFHGGLIPEGPAVVHWSWPVRRRTCPSSSLSGLIRGVGLDTLMSTAAAAGANVDGFMWDVLNSLQGPAGSARFESWFGEELERAGGVEGRPSAKTVGWARGALDRLFNEALGPGVSPERGPAGREAEREAEKHHHKPDPGYRPPPGRVRGLRWLPVRKCPVPPFYPPWWRFPLEERVPDLAGDEEPPYDVESPEDQPLRAVVSEDPLAFDPGVWLDGPVLGSDVVRE